MKKVILAVTCFLSVVFYQAVLMGSTYYVNGIIGDDYRYDGTAATPESPCFPPPCSGPKRTIQAGIDIASSGDTVIIAEGIYTGDGNRDLDLGGRDITVRSIDPNDPNIVAATVIDGEGNWDLCVYYSCCEIHRGFLFRSGEDSNSVLAGVTITRFCAPQDELIWGQLMPAGAGIFCEDSSPTISNCVITDNWAHRLGEGGFGGGIYCKGNSSPTITHCTISECESYHGGGGIHSNSGDPTITKCIIKNNTAGMGIGGIACGAGATITYSIISNNHGTSGGIRTNGTISYCTIVNNTSDFLGGGGGIKGSPTIEHCTISNNQTSPGPGGGIYFTSGTAVVKNSTITGNSAGSGDIMGEWFEGQGGGVFCQQGNPIITQCTIADNNAAHGGGIYGDPNIANSILWDNTAPNEPEISGNPAVSYSNVEGGWPGASNINVDPCFAGADNNDYHLKSQAGRWDPNSENWVTDANTSPCIDAGNPGCPLGDEPNDANNIRINMGAYGGTAEASKTPADWRNIADLTNDWIVDFNDLNIFVNYWLETGQCIPSDLSRNEFIDFKDFCIFSDNWLWQ